MNKSIIFLQEYRWKIVIGFTILYWILVYLFGLDKRFWLIIDLSDWAGYIFWYLIILRWIFYTPKDESIEIYFTSGLFFDVETLINDKGFEKCKETKTNAIYKKELSRWNLERISIFKSENGIWILNCEEKNIEGFEKFMVRYKNRGM